HTDDLAGSDRQAHAVDRFDRTVVFADVLDFEEDGPGRHFPVPRRLNRSASDSSPPGRNTISTITAKPKIARYQSWRNRSHSGSSTTITEPSTGPKNRPEPPTITASSMMSDTET